MKKKIKKLRIHKNGGGTRPSPNPTDYAAGSFHIKKYVPIWHTHSSAYYYGSRGAFLFKIVF